MWSVWSMILKWRNTIKMSIELPVTTRHRRDMKEKLLKAMLNQNKQQHKVFAHYTGRLRHTNQTLRFDPRFVQLSASGSWDSGFESLLRQIYHLTERDTRRLTCTASDVRDRVRNQGQDNVTNINTGSGVRRIIFKRQQCMYKSEHSILIKICWPEMPAHIWLFSRDNN